MQVQASGSSVMASYCAYGLIIQSNLDLPQLEESSATPDLTVRRGRVDAPFAFPRAGRKVWSENGTVWLFCGKRGALRIRDGKEILVDPAPGVDARIIHNWVIGQGLGVAMSQRGLFVLHAGVVKVGHAGVAFMGPSGSGKSTMVMALCHAGYAVLADDHAVIDDRHGATVFSGFPQVKLREDSLRTFRRHGDAVGCGKVSEEKLGWDIRENFAPCSVPLRSIYVLAEAPEVRITELSQEEAAAELGRNSFLSSLSIKPACAVTHLERSTRLAARVPLRRLERPRSYTDLPSLVRLLEEAHEMECCEQAVASTA
jgi:Serine kinase of the HPr protein, regulates carbohydrate metabolism